MKKPVLAALILLAAAALLPAQTPAPAAIQTWTAPVPHLFFHPAIAFPELAFTGVSKADLEFIDSWFNTVPEIKAVFQQLYDRGYVLVDIYDTVDLTTFQAKPFTLPAGKKPLILSLDDLNFYPDTVKLGTNRRLFVDDKGVLKALGYDGKGREIISTDNEVVTILDNFVAAHPDFSLRGAKGIIALTGYYGFFGWATHHPERPGYAGQLAGAKAVAIYLKAKGWQFASHSWAHKRPAAIDDATFRDIETKWRTEANLVLGPVDLYIYPFGMYIDSYKTRMEWLKKDGFKVFFGVGAHEPRFEAGSIHLDRLNIDGKTLRQAPALMAPFYDAKTVIDPVRPKKL